MFVCYENKISDINSFLLRIIGEACHPYCFYILKWLGDDGWHFQLIMVSKYCFDNNSWCCAQLSGILSRSPMFSLKLHSL